MLRVSQIKAFRSLVLGINKRNVDYISESNPRKYYKLADDKHITKTILEKHKLACPKTYGVIDKIGEIEPIWKESSNHDQIVIKPAKGRGGGGILILKKKNGQWYKGNTPYSNDQIFTHIANIIFGIYSIGDQDKAILEECINNHPFFSEIYDNGVPDFRIIVYKNKPVMGMLRFPTRKSNGKANLHQGGLGIGVDMETGKLMQSYNGHKYHDAHPDSGVIICDKQLPYWEEIIQLSVDTAKVFPLDFLGVDIIIDKVKGPVIMEINVRPGLGIQLANKKGLKHELKKTLIL